MRKRVPDCGNSCSIVVLTGVSRCNRPRHQEQEGEQSAKGQQVSGDEHEGDVVDWINHEDEENGADAVTQVVNEHRSIKVLLFRFMLLLEGKRSPEDLISKLLKLLVLTFSASKSHRQRSGQQFS